MPTDPRSQAEMGAHSSPGAGTEAAPETGGGIGDRVRLAVVGAVFTVSGISALVYQVSWQRILALHSGAGIYSVAMIVAAFLAGLGLGSAVGAGMSRRMRPRRALLTFAALELAVGLLALASPTLYYDLLYLRAPELYAHWWVAAPLHFLILLPPTALMGMSLPFLVQAMVRDPLVASRTVGLLYGLNVLGAAAGAIAAPWVLIRFFGMEGAIFTGAAGNLLAGLTALLLCRSQPDEEQHSATVHAVVVPEGAEPAGSRPFGLWMALYATSGFCALALEILWFRVMDVAVKSTAFTFGTVLAVFLLGLGVGSLAGGWLALRFRRPLLAFLACQGALIAYAAAAAFALAVFPTGSPVYESLFEYWGSYEEFGFGRAWDAGRLVLLYVALPMFLFFPATLLMGLSFGILQRAVHDDAGTTGFKVGVLQAVNIVGNIAGSLLTGLVLMHWLGTPATFRLLMVIGLAFIGLGLRYYGLRGSLVVPGAVLLVLLTGFPGEERFWARFHGLQGEPSLFVEDSSAVVAIGPEPGYGLRVSINGKGHSNLPFGGIHSRLGAVPALVHPDPKSVAIIGLGSGDTAWAAGCRPETELVRVFEIAASVESALRGLRGVGIPQLRSFLEDPRVKIEITDGRNALAREETKYDVIEADALRPHSAYSGNLYSREFFELCARRLRPGGMMCAWAPTRRTYHTFTLAFPHVIELNGGEMLLGSNEAIPITPQLWRTRIRSREIVEYLGAPAGDIDRVLGTARLVRAVAEDDRKPNSDLFPRDEFLTPPLD